MSQKRRILPYVLAYLLWIVSTGLGAIVLNLVRETIMLAMVVAGSSSELTKSEQFYQSLRVAAATHWSILIIGLFVLIMLVGLEHFYRESIEKGILWRRFFRVTGLQLSVLFVSHAIYFILQQNIVQTGWWAIVIPAVEFLLAAVFLALSSFVQKSPEP